MLTNKVLEKVPFKYQTTMAQRLICTIAREIKKDWKNVSPYAEPYLQAMLYLSDIKDHYGFDSGKTIVSYFLSNAGTWRGDTAKRIKAELRQMIK